MKVTATIWIDFETNAEEPVSSNVGFKEILNALLSTTAAKEDDPGAIEMVWLDGEVSYLIPPEFSVEPFDDGDRRAKYFDYQAPDQGGQS